MAPKRARRREKEDRLSALPDHVLLHILSFLDMKDVVCTGILASRWRYLWTFLPNLHFRGVTSDQDRFVRFVDRTLLRHSASKIHKFRLSFFRNPSSGIDLWIRFAVNKGVEELELNAEDRLNFYKLPGWLFKCETLVSLKLSECTIEVVPHFARFSSLAELSLSNMYFTGEMVLLDLLAACPQLEDFVIESFSYTTSLRISSSRLKHLKITGDRIGNVEVDAPNLQIFNFSAAMDGHCSFKDMPSLVQANINVSNFNVSGVLASPVQNLRHAKVLELSTDFIKAMHNLTFKDLHSYIFETKCLILTTEVNKIVLPGIANLLWSSPNLETLVIKLIPLDWLDESDSDDDAESDSDDDEESDSDDDDHITRKNDSNEREYWESLTVSFSCLVHRLKSIKITNFTGYSTDPCDEYNEEVSLVRFLLRNAMILEKLTIHAREPYSETKEEWPKIMLNVAQKLIAIPRASPYVDVLFSYDQ